MKVVVPDEALLEHIFDLTFPIWHDGLTRGAYAQWDTGQTRIPWARDHFGRFALTDDRGILLASLKRYRYDIRLEGRDGWMCGLGAVFTPPDRRGHGYAAQLIERVLDRERRDGALMATLFSEIGARFYERLGFVVVPLDEVTVRARLHGGAPAMLVRAGDERDLPDIAAMDAVRAVGAKFALRRDPAAIQFALKKKRLFAGLSPAGARQIEFFVAEEGSSAAAYVVISQNRHGWTLEDAGDRDPQGARVGAMLQVLVAREPSRRHPLIRAWWPRAFPVPPQIELMDRSDAKDLMMVRALSDAAVPRTADDVYYWRGDYF
jgi:GNAT superfamily N-acetyltransferase